MGLRQNTVGNNTICARKPEIAPFIEAGLFSQGEQPGPRLTPTLVSLRPIERVSLERC